MCMKKTAKQHSMPAETGEKQQCRNCDTPFVGHFCPQCGQSSKDINRPLRFISEEFLGTLFAFDTRFWRSLSAVVLRPGWLVKDLIEGRRQRYMPPFRMYVFVSFFLILLLGFYNQSPHKKDAIFKVSTNKEGALKQVADSLANDTLKHPVRTETDSTGVPGAIGSASPATTDVSTTTEALFLESLNKPKALYDTFSRFFSWAMFLLMPLYGFLLWVFFRKSYRFYVPHFFLSIVQHILVSLLMILIVLIKLIFPEKAVNPEEYLMWLIPVYAAMGAMQLYRLKWYSVLWRMAIIMGFYFLIVLISMSVIFYYSMVQVSAAV